MQVCTFSMTISLKFKVYLETSLRKSGIFSKYTESERVTSLVPLLYGVYYYVRIKERTKKKNLLIPQPAVAVLQIVGNY